MARQPRIEYEGAFYHVTSRGNLKDNIFYEDADRIKLIEILRRTKERYGYIVHELERSKELRSEIKNVNCVL